MTFDASKVRALLFDLDGTLIDSRDDIAASANALRSLHGLEALPVPVIGSYIGDGIESLVRRVMGAEFEAHIPALTEEFRRHYHEHCVEKTYLYDGVRETLAELKRRGYRMAVVTNKPERISRRILELLGVEQGFGAVIGGNTCPTKKPDPGPLKEACKRLDLSTHEAAMVGDSRVDVEAGHNARMPSVAVQGGIGDQQALLAAGPALVLRRFSGLLDHFPGAA